VLVKRFRVPARNQELILIAFEEPVWPLVIGRRCPAIQAGFSERQ